MNPLTRLISRKEAKALGLTHYFTGLPCKHGHLALRTVSKYACGDCRRMHDRSEKKRAQNARWQAAHKEQERERQRRWGEDNRERKRANSRASYLRNRTKVLERTAIRHKANKARRLAQKQLETTYETDHDASETIAKA
jgi:hypothetical protein